MDKAGIAARFRQAIKALGYRNLAQFARETEMPRSTVYALGSDGRRPYTATLETLEQIGVNMEYVLDGNGPPLLHGVSDMHSRYIKAKAETPEVNLMEEIRRLAHEPENNWELFSLVMQTIELMEPGQQRLIYLGLKEKFEQGKEVKNKEK